MSTFAEAILSVSMNGISWTITVFAQLSKLNFQALDIIRILINPDLFTNTHITRSVINILFITVYTASLFSIFFIFDRQSTAENAYKMSSTIFVFCIVETKLLHT